MAPINYAPLRENSAEQLIALEEQLARSIERERKRQEEEEAARKKRKRKLRGKT